MEDDKREAVNIGVTLSTQLIAASLTMIAVIGAFATFVIDKKEIGVGYYLIIGIAFLSFVGSIFSGGKGIDTALKHGFDGKWEIKETKVHFNRQAIFCFLGLLFFVISIFFGDEKMSIEAEGLTNTEEEIFSLKLLDSLNRSEINVLKTEIIFLKSEVEELKKSSDTSFITK